MTQVNAVDLKPYPSRYQSSRAVGDVLIGVDIAIPLFEASSSGDITALQGILEDSPEIALESPHRIYDLERPAKDGDDVRHVRASVWSNVDRAMLRAAKNGHVEAVSILLDFASRNGLKPSSVIDRDTVIAALQNRDAAMFDVLATADRSVASHYDVHPNQQPLDWALKLSDIDLIKVILRHGGGSSRPKRSGRTSRLSEAARKDKIILELLIQQGYIVKGSGALQSAAQQGRLDNMRLLVEEHGADVNERLPKDKVMRIEEDLYSSWTPLHWAASRAKEDAMKLLESYGADVGALDVEGRTPAQLAQEWKDGKSYTKTLSR